MARSYRKDAGNRELKVRHLFILFSLLCSVLYAAPLSRIEIYAGEMKTHAQTIELSKEIVVVYGDYVLMAKRARYDKDKALLELFGNVKVLSDKKFKILGEYARIDLHNKKRLFKPFYMLDSASQVWLSAQKGCDTQQEIDISRGVLSGCNPQDPLWQIEFSSSDYDKEKKWLNLYNAVLYIYDIPVLYTPYFGYSLDKTRRSGLLTPSFGYSSYEGLYFEQPLYIAEQNWWDLELRPQIRTKRGHGTYGTFRFIDSKSSKGEIDLGYFKEKQSYMQEYELANKHHYGANFHYTNSDLLGSMFGMKSDAQSALYVDAVYMNDVDYINLATNDTTKTSTPSQTISRANLFYNTEKDYIATYFKYYVDLTKESNARTIQQLPSLHYHRYLDTLLLDHLLYNFNVKSTYLYREQGTTSVQTDIEIPIKLRTSLFNEYLNLSYENFIYGQSTTFKQKENDFLQRNGYYLRTYNQFALSTQLTKPYAETIHSIGFSASYIQNGMQKRNGFYQDNKNIDCNDPKNSEICIFYKLTDIQEALLLDFTQYLYDSNGKQMLYHRLTDIISNPTQNNASVGELESELDLALSKSLSYYNNFLYNFSRDNFSKQFNKITYKTDKYDISFSHFYSKNFSLDTKTSYVTSALKYRYNTHYSYKAAYDYDLEKRKKKRAEIGFLYEKRCWNFGLRYAENNRPILTNNNEASSVFDRYVYFTLVLKPLMKPTPSDFFGLRLPKVLQTN